MSPLVGPAIIGLTKKVRGGGKAGEGEALVSVPGTLGYAQGTTASTASRSSVTLFAKRSLDVILGTLLLLLAAPLILVLALIVKVSSPGPVVPDELRLYGDKADLYTTMRPGLTGYWQVQGRSAVIGQERIQLDRYYLEHFSVWLDVRILFQTLPAVVRGRGAE